MQCNRAGVAFEKGNKTPNILDSVTAETLEELKYFSDKCLEKAGLVELSEKLHALADERAQ